MGKLKGAAKEADEKKKIAVEIAKRIGTPACIIFVAVACVMFFLIRQQVVQSKETELTFESQSAYRGK